MNDGKRELRELKRQIKKSGNRKRRRYLKDFDADPAGFNFGRDKSDTMNESRNQSRRSREVPDRNDE